MERQVTDLSEFIEEVRRELIQLGTCKPLVDPDVIRMSQRLDRLMNEYEYLKQQIYLRREFKGA